MPETAMVLNGVVTKVTSKDDIPIAKHNCGASSHHVKIAFHSLGQVMPLDNPM